MKFTARAAFMLMLISTFFCVNQQSKADLVGPSASALFDATGGNGTSGNNTLLFDGDLFANTADAGFFDTDVYLRERGNLAQTNLRVGAIIDFDVSSFTSSVDEAILEFSAYQLNGTTDLEVSQLTGADGFDPTVINTINAGNLGAQGTGSFAIDVTAIVNDWIANPANNLGFYLGLDTTTNDGIGIFDGTATQINDGSVLGAFTGVPIPDDFKALALHVTTVPEPTGALLLTFGGLALVARRRR